MSKEEDFEKWRMGFSKQFKWDQLGFTPYEPTEEEHDRALAYAQSIITDLELMSMDMLEHEVTESKNTQAREMLAAIGIKCDDKTDGNSKRFRQ